MEVPLDQHEGDVLLGCIGQPLPRVRQQAVGAIRQALFKLTDADLHGEVVLGVESSPPLGKMAAELAVEDPTQRPFCREENLAIISVRSAQSPSSLGPYPRSPVCVGAAPTG